MLAGSYSPTVAILGATGRVGQELLSILEKRQFPVAELKLLASSRSKETTLNFRGRQYPVIEASGADFQGIDIVFGCTNEDISRELTPLAVKAGALVIDNSSAFRMDPLVPLVVPEVNAQALHNHKGLIANPNCSTIQMVVVLKPLHEAAGLKRVIVSTYQSVSGAGKEAMDELKFQTQAIINGTQYQPSVFNRQIAFNLIPHIDRFMDDGYTREERKIIQETQKILELPGLLVTATSVRVPVVVGHSESILVELETQISPAQAREVLKEAPGIEVWDDPLELKYPTPIDAAGEDPVYVGRIRKDTSSSNGLNLWVVADNLRVGAALNAVRIAEYLLAHDLLNMKQPVAV